MYLDAQYLRQLIYNVLLWTPGKGDAKKYQSGGAVQMTVGDGLSFLSTDGYVVVRSGVPVDGTEIYFKGEDLKRVLQDFPSDDGDVEVTHGEGKWYFGKTEVEPVEVLEPDFWETVAKILATVTELDPRSTRFHKFYLDRHRVQKFNLVEPRSENYPLAMRQLVTTADQAVLGWKYGPYLQGILAPLVEELLWERYPDDNGKVLWE